MDFHKVLSVEEAKDIINTGFSLKLQKEFIDLKKCNNRVLYEDIDSPLNIPGFKRSIVDGYAVKWREGSQYFMALLRMIMKVYLKLQKMLLKNVM